MWDSIVVMALKKIYAVITNLVDDSMFLCNPSRPNIWPQILQVFGFTYALEWIFQDFMY